MTSQTSNDVMTPEGVDFRNVSGKLAALRLGNVFVACGAAVGIISAVALVAGIDEAWMAMPVPSLIALWCPLRLRPCVTLWPSATSLFAGAS